MIRTGFGVKLSTDEDKACSRTESGIVSIEVGVGGVTWSGAASTSSDNCDGAGGGGDVMLLSCSCSLLDISLSSLTGCKLDGGTSMLRNGDMLLDLPDPLLLLTPLIGPLTVGDGGVKLRAGERDLLLVLLPILFLVSFKKFPIFYFHNN